MAQGFVHYAHVLNDDALLIVAKPALVSYYMDTHVTILQ